MTTPLPSQPAVVQQPMPQQVMYNQQPGMQYGQPMQYMMQQPQYVVQDNMQQAVSDAAFHQHLRKSCSCVICPF